MASELGAIARCQRYPRQHSPWFQPLTALIALLIVKYLQATARFGWSFSTLIALLRMNLFVYRDVWVWLDDPFSSPPLPPDPEQGTFAWS